MRVLRFFLLLLVAVAGFSAQAQASPGDTTWVHAFQFGQSQDSMITFPAPPGGSQWERILMYYTLKCVPGGAGGLQFPCGEWDYLTYTYLYHKPGTQDSIEYQQPSYWLTHLLNYPTYNYTTAPQTTQRQWWERARTYTGTTNLTTASISGNMMVAPWQNSTHANGQAQYLFTAAELATAGLVAGPITGLQLDVASTGADVKHFRIAMKHSSLGSLSTGQFEAGGFTTVLEQNQSFAATGMVPFAFTTDFVWDGTSNLLVELSYTNTQVPPAPSAALNLNANNAAGMGLALSTNEHALRAYPGQEGFFQLENEAYFDSISNELSVECWFRVDGWNAAWQTLVAKGDNSWRLARWDQSNGLQFDANGLSNVTLNTNVNVNDGQWHHVAFTLAGGESRLYLDGVQVAAASGVTGNIAKNDFPVMVGNNAQQMQRGWNGLIDDVRIWRRGLTAQEVQDWRHRKLEATHPQYAHLLVNYDFDFSQPLDYSPAPNHGPGPGGLFMGTAYPAAIAGPQLHQALAEQALRPNLTFEQRTYTATLDSTIRTDVWNNPPFLASLFQNPATPTTATDSLWVWPAGGFTYLYSPTGAAIDSTPVAITGTFTRTYLPYYGQPFDVVNRFELGRFITPYGINLDLGAGWTWVYDVSDYAPVLNGEHRLTAGNWQELLDLRFAFVEGTPPRDVHNIQNVYTDYHPYGTSAQIEATLPPVTLPVGPNSTMSKLRSTITGHGFGGTLNCAEFCYRQNEIYANGSYAYDEIIWNATCGSNPLYPQGGTWIYDRAGWCPGAPGDLHQFELTPYTTAGNPMTIDYAFQTGYAWNGQGSYPYYQMELQFVTYGSANFATDARMEEIISPSNETRHSRQNPVCGKPRVVFRNTGSTPLTSLDIHYGVVGGSSGTYTWTGNLPFDQTMEVSLPGFNNHDLWTGSNRFWAATQNPNGQQDQYPTNDTLWSTFQPSIEATPTVIIVFQSNGAASETKWYLYNEAGTVVAQHTVSQANTTYYDTLTLGDGCYELRVLDTGIDGGDGLSFFANNDGDGYIELRDAQGFQLRPINPDFGSEVSVRFIIDQVPSSAEDRTPPAQAHFDVFPNPNNGVFQFNAELPAAEELTLTVSNTVGQVVVHQTHPAAIRQAIPVNLAGHPAGVYTVTARTAGGQVFSQRVVVQ